MPLIPTTQRKLTVERLPYIIHTATVDQEVSIHVANNSDNPRDMAEEEKIQIYLLKPNPNPDPTDPNIDVKTAIERRRHYILLGYIPVLNNQQHITNNVYLAQGDKLYANCSYNRLTVTIMGKQIV